VGEDHLEVGLLEDHLEDLPLGDLEEEGHAFLEEDLDLEDRLEEEDRACQVEGHLVLEDLYWVAFHLEVVLFGHLEEDLLVCPVLRKHSSSFPGGQLLELLRALRLQRCWQKYFKELKIENDTYSGSLCKTFSDLFRVERIPWSIFLLSVILVGSPREAVRAVLLLTAL